MYRSRRIAVAVCSALLAVGLAHGARADAPAPLDYKAYDGWSDARATTLAT